MQNGSRQDTHPLLNSNLPMHFGDHNRQTSGHLFSYTYKQRRLLLYEEWNAPEVWKYGIWY
jgi:hypothetical protein